MNNTIDKNTIIVLSSASHLHNSNKLYQELNDDKYEL